MTEHSSLPSLPTPFAKWLLLSPLRRAETAPGFSPWGLVMPHCGTSCLVLNFPINSFNQHRFAQAGRCRERCHAARSQIGRCSQLLTQEKQDSWQMDDNDTSTHLLCRLISFQIAVAQKLAWESHRVKWKMWKQSWDFRTFGIHKVEVLRTYAHCQLSQQ